MAVFSMVHSAAIKRVLTSHGVVLWWVGSNSPPKQALRRGWLMVLKKREEAQPRMIVHGITALQCGSFRLASCWARRAPQ